MKNIFSIVSIILTVAASSISQDSSTIYLWDTDFSILKRDTVTFQSTGEKKQFTEPIDLENIRALTFLQNDSLAVTPDTGITVYMRLADIYEVRKYEYRFSPVLGAIITAGGGALIGGIVGYTIYGSGNDVKQNAPFWQLGAQLEKQEGAITGALIGALCGGVLGFAITTAINNPMLDLLSVPEKEKKAKLIKFLRSK